MTATRATLVAMVRAADGGGMHRDELAAWLGLTAGSPAFAALLWPAYRAGLVDLCGAYVVVPARA